MSHGGLPPRRPDQYAVATPRGTTPGARIERLGGTPGSQSTTSGAQAPTTFFTFAAPSRIRSAEISYAVAANNSFSPTQQFYARVSVVTAAFGTINLGNVQLALGAASSAVNGQGGRDFNPAGLPVAKGDTLQLDVNNGVSPNPGGTGGTMRAECAVDYVTP